MEQKKLYSHKPYSHNLPYLFFGTVYVHFGLFLILAGKKEFFFCKNDIVRQVLSKNKINSFFKFHLQTNNLKWHSKLISKIGKTSTFSQGH